AEAVGIGILIESIRVFDGQSVFFKPVIRYRGMNLCVLQRRRQTVSADKMSFRNEKPGAPSGFPLRGMLELLCGAIEFNSRARRRRIFRRSRSLADQPGSELDDAPPSAYRGNQKKECRRDERNAIVMPLKPVHNGA